MTSYDQFKRDTERVAMFGWKIIFVVLLGSTAYVIAEGLLSAIPEPGNTLSAILAVLVGGLTLGAVAVLTMRRWWR